MNRSERIPRSINWPLILGVIFVAFVAYLAVVGPDIAPKDPLEENTIIKAGDEWFTPPFPVGIPGFPLGSDDVGRDLLSRLLWGIRPTFSMVLIVATIRLIAGTGIGLIAGWTNNWAGRSLDTLISAALAIPVIMVALGGIAAVGVELGIFAFIIGLSLTGWVETARIVRERTAAVRGQVFIEASRGLGATSPQMLIWHVLRQVISMIWMLFAFEISGTLMLTATLGFLGYYIGGDVWVQVTDATARAISGSPELGQMLATSAGSVTQPWGLLAIGVVVFSAVLGFNLVGEGLRQRASFTIPRRRNILNEFFSRVGLWIDNRIFYPLSNFFGKRAVRVTVAVFIAVAAGAWGMTTFGEKLFPNTGLAPRTFDAPIWGTTYGDPGGSRYANFSGPDESNLAWTFKHEAGFIGGPVVGKDGTIVIIGADGPLFVVDDSGNVISETALPVLPAAGTALGADGTIYIPDIEGGLSAYSPEGAQVWRVNKELGRAATAAPVTGTDGVIYYPTASLLHAVSPTGELLWSTNYAPPGGGLSPVRVAENTVFFETISLDKTDGTNLEYLPLAAVDEYIIGADGKTYFRKSNDITPWEAVETGLEPAAMISWEFRSFTTGRPQVSGVTPDGSIWLFYSSFSRSRGFGEDTRIVWLDPSGDVNMNINYPTRNSTPVAIDKNRGMYVCGNLDQGYGPIECQLFKYGADAAAWTIALEGFEMAGGALAPNRLYVSTTDGYLHAIGKGASASGEGDNDGAEQIVGAKQPTPTPIRPTPIPLEVESGLFFSNESGFSGPPASSPIGLIYIATNNGTLFALDSEGEIVWQALLADRSVGGPAVFGDILYIADRTGLSAFDLSGTYIWRFEQRTGTTVGGPAVGPDGTIYYTIDIGSRGNIQAVSDAGEALWQTQVKTFSYYRTPQISAGGDLIFFKEQAFRAADGSLVDLAFDFEPDELFAGENGENYLRLQDTVARWTFDGTTGEMAEERIISPVGSIQAVGVTIEGVVWMQTRQNGLWFNADGTAIGASNNEVGFYSHMLALEPDLTMIVCGRDQRNFQSSGKTTCIALSPLTEDLVWSVVLSEDREEFTGGFKLGDAYFAATESGNLYVIRKK